MRNMRWSCSFIAYMIEANTGGCWGYRGKFITFVGS